MSRFVPLLLALVLSFLGGPSWSYGTAEYGQQKLYYGNCSNGTNVSGKSSADAVAAACLALIPKTGSTYANGCTRTYYDDPQIQTHTQPGSNDYYTFGGTRSYSTPAGCQAQPSGYVGLGGLTVSSTTTNACTPGASLLPGETSKCGCDLGYKPDPAAPGKCVPYSCGPSGSYTGTIQPDIWMDGVGDQCMNGCGVKPSEVKTASDGRLFGVWPFISTGATCGGKDTSATDKTKTGNTVEPAPVACGANQCPGTVNGANVCVACKSTTIQGPSSEASAPGSAASGAGSTTTSTTECTQSRCTTTTTTKDGAGNVTGTTKKEEGQESFCKSNPDASICKKSAFGGQCATTTCEGDAIQCALAREVYKRNCEWATVDDTMKALGTTALGAGIKSAEHPGANPEAKSLSFASAISQTELLGGGCPSDVTVSVAGRVVVIPWSRTCSALQMVGQLAVAVCMLAAAFIVFRS